MNQRALIEITYRTFPVELTSNQLNRNQPFGNDFMGAHRQNRTSIVSLVVILFTHGPAAHSQSIGTMTPVTKFIIHSNILNEDRQIAIYRPPVLDEFPENVPPVIYVLDGELTTELVRAHVGYFTEIWKELPPIMVVGIENLKGMSNRTRDLTPTKSRLGNGGGADQFMRFLQEEVITVVEKNHKQRPYRVLAGSSSAGLFTIHSFLNHATFDAFIATSPTLAWNNSRIMNDIGKKLNAIDSKKVLFFCVGNEGGQYLPHAITLDSLLNTKRLPNVRHRFIHYPDETHGTVPLKGYYEGFKFIFRVGPEDLNVPLEDITYKTIEDYYGEWTSIFGFPMKPREFVINEYGYKFLYATRQVDKALHFFKKNIENYPHSANAYDSYAEALLLNGNKQDALANYEKALELNPNNKHAAEVIEKLKQELH